MSQRIVFTTLHFLHKLQTDQIKSFVKMSQRTVFTTHHFLHKLQTDQISLSFTLQWAGKTLQGQALQLIGPIFKL
jgi:hypothetical protein